MESEGKDVIPNKPGVQDNMLTGRSYAGEPEGTAALVRVGGQQLMKDPLKHSQTSQLTYTCIHAQRTNRNLHTVYNYFNIQH